MAVKTVPFYFAVSIHIFQQILIQIATTTEKNDLYQCKVNQVQKGCIYHRIETLHSFFALSGSPTSFSRNDLFNSILYNTHAITDYTDIGKTFLENDCIHIAIIFLTTDLTQLIDVDRIPKFFCDGKCSMNLNVKSMEGTELYITTNFL